MARANLTRNLNLTIKNLTPQKLLNAIMTDKSHEIKKDVEKKLPKVKVAAVAAPSVTKNGLKVPIQGLKDKRKIKTRAPSTEEINNAISMRYALVAMLFYKIVARTPVDESYAYEVKDESKEDFINAITKKSELGLYYRTYDKKNKKYVVRKRSARQRYEHKYKVAFRKHEKNDVVIRNEWHLQIGSTKAYTTASFDGVNWDAGFKTDGDLSADNGWKTIYNIITANAKGGKLTKLRNFQTYKIWNTSKYWKVLEFGEYKNKQGKPANTAMERTTDSSGSRPHGTYKGYSVQAPKGMVAKTLAELETLEDQAARGEYGTYGYNREDVKRVNDEKLYGINSEKNNVLDSYDNHIKMVVHEYQLKLNEKEFLEAIMHNRKNASVYLSAKMNEEKEVSEEYAEADVKRRAKQAYDKDAYKRRAAIEKYNKQITKGNYFEGSEPTEETLKLYEELQKPMRGTVADNPIYNIFILAAFKTTKTESFYEDSMQRKVMLNTFFGNKVTDNYITFWVIDGKLYKDENGRTDIPLREYKKYLENADEY